MRSGPPGLHFALELDPALLRDDLLDLLDQTEHVTGGCLAPIHDEVAVLLADDRVPAHSALRAAVLDQHPGRAPAALLLVRVLPHATRRPLGHGLDLVLLRQVIAAGLPHGCDGAQPELQKRARDHVPAEVRVAVARVALGARELDESPLLFDDEQALDDIPHLAVLAAGVHPDAAADLAGHAG